MTALAQNPSAAWKGVEYSRSTIYHSEQKPGFTCWVGAWLMPDQAMMVSFTEATGPISGRPKTPPEFRKRLSWPPQESYDMNGLDLRNVHLSSTDRGKTWKKVSSEGFRSPINYITGNGETALTEGAIVRGVWGFYLVFDPAAPSTGFVQRSTDGAVTWSKPIVLLDPNHYTTFPVRLRQLSDGRLLLLGGLSRAPANGPLTREDHWKLLEPLMMVSEDGGRTWEGPLDVIPPDLRKDWYGEEYDAAELPNGDLLCVFRRDRPNGRERWQALLKKEGKRWKIESVARSPLPPSGHPDLLATREGIVLHFATTGVDWTSDAGKTWGKLQLRGTAHYPRSVQLPDGQIHVFSHVGGDDGFGRVDQSIIMESFRLSSE